MWTCGEETEELLSGCQGVMGEEDSQPVSVWPMQPFLGSAKSGEGAGGKALPWLTVAVLIGASYASPDQFWVLLSLDSPYLLRKWRGELVEGESARTAAESHYEWVLLGSTTWCIFVVRLLGSDKRHHGLCLS